MAMVAEMGNLLLSFMSAWMVGNVEAPANANIIEPKAGKKEKEFVLTSKYFISSTLPLKQPSMVGGG